MGGRWSCYIVIEYKNKKRCYNKTWWVGAPKCRYYVDVSTNVNDILEVNLSKEVHRLPIDLAEPTCGMQQVKKS